MLRGLKFLGAFYGSFYCVYVPGGVKRVERSPNNVRQTTEVPEPLTILGTITFGGFIAGMKKRRKVDK